MKKPIPEQHSFQFQGIWLHAELLDLLMDKKITGTDLLLFTTIVALSETDLGCQASNSNLSKIVGVIPHRISVLLQKLKALGVIEVYRHEGQRRIRRIRTMPFE